MNFVEGTSAIATDEYFYPEATFKKSNTFINARYSASALEQKMLALSLAHAQRSEGKIVAHLPVNQVRRLMQKDYKSFYAALKVAGINLSRIQFMTEDQSTHSWRIDNLFKNVTSKEGNFTAVFNEDFERDIFSLQSNYTILGLPTLLRFEHTTTIRLYETIKSRCFYPKCYSGTKDGKYVIEINLDELKVLMGACDLNHTRIASLFDDKESIDYTKVIETACKIAEEDAQKKTLTPKERYKKPKWEKWADFKRRALEPAIEEINTLAQESPNVKDIIIESFEHYGKGKGGKVDNIVFYITDTSYAPVEDKVTDQDSGIDLDDLVDELRDIFTEKVSTKDIKHILKTADNDIEKVKKAYEVVSKMQYNNFVASMITAIKDEWQPAIKAKKKNSFTGCSQREYDFDELEKQLCCNK